MNFTGIQEEYMIYGMLFAVSNRIQTVGDEQFDDITMKQHFLMITLDLMEGEAPSLKEMADTIGCSYQNVKRMALQLEKNGYLKLETDPTDGRKLRLVSTGKFQKLGQEAEQDTKQFMKMMYQGIPREDLVTTLNTLIQMEKNIGGHLV